MHCTGETKRKRTMPTTMMDKHSATDRYSPNMSIHRGYSVEGKKKHKKNFKDAVYFRDWVGVGWGSRGEVMCRFPCWVNMALSISIVPPTTRKLVGIRLKLACTCFLQKDCLVKGGIKRKTVGEPRSMLSWYCATSRCRSEPPNGYPAVSKWLTKTAYKARPRGRQGYRTESNWPHYPSF